MSAPWATRRASCSASISACDRAFVTDIRALYFDGRSSDGHNVTLGLDAQDVLRVRGAGIDLGWPLAGVRVSDRIGSSRRYLYFPGGSQCETDDNDAVDQLFAAHARAGGRLLHGLESRLRYAVAALVITVAAAAAFVVWGIPALAKQAAFHLPPATEKLVGRGALPTLDRFGLAPGRLPPQRHAALR